MFIYSLLFLVGVMVAMFFHLWFGVNKEQPWGIPGDKSPIELIQKYIGKRFGNGGEAAFGALAGIMVLASLLTSAACMLLFSFLVVICIIGFKEEAVSNDALLCMFMSHSPTFLINFVGIIGYRLSMKAVVMYRKPVRERNGLFGKVWNFVGRPIRRLIDACYDPKERAIKKMRKDIAAILAKLDDSPRWDYIKEALQQIDGEERSEGWFTATLHNIQDDVKQIRFFSSKADQVVAEARAQGLTVVIERVGEFVNEVYPKLVADRRRLINAQNTMGESLSPPGNLATPFEAERYTELHADYKRIGTQRVTTEAAMCTCEHILSDLTADMAAIAVADIVEFDVAGRLAAIAEQTREIKGHARATAAEVAETTADAARRRVHLVAAGKPGA